MVGCCLMFVKQSEKMMVMLREKNSKERLCLIYVFFRFLLFSWDGIYHEGEEIGRFDVCLGFFF